MADWRMGDVASNDLETLQSFSRTASRVPSHANGPRDGRAKVESGLAPRIHEWPPICCQSPRLPIIHPNREFQSQTSRFADAQLGIVRWIMHIPQ